MGSITLAVFMMSGRDVLVKRSGLVYLPAPSLDGPALHAPVSLGIGRGQCTTESGLG